MDRSLGMSCTLRAGPVGDDAAEWAKIYTMVFPPYQLLIESYTKAQEVVTKHEKLDSA